MTIAKKLAEERRARLAAERLLELKQAELFAANRKLGRHARQLSHEIVETRAEVATVRNENLRVKSDLTAAHNKIELVERRLWQSVQTIQDGFAIYDEQNILIAANRAYLSVFDGLDEAQPGISYPRMLQLLTEEGIVDTEGENQTAWRAKMITRWQSAHPEPIVIRLWNQQYIKMIDQRGVDGDVVSLALNITSTVLYEAQLREAHQRAEAANRAKSAFLANMSHEIRTPMNGVVGMADLLNESPLSKEQKIYVETIRNSGEALLVIINDILDYSKIEAEKLELNPEPFDLEKSVHDVVTLLRPGAREKGLEVAIDYDMFLPTHFVGDPGRIRQVLTNLVGNAVKFTSQGHVLIRIIGDPISETHAAIHIAVEDTGIGIPKAKLEHIFGEFNQVDDDRNRQFEGTGLGLAISKRLIELMNGTCWVTSTENEGSCFGFRIELPKANVSETEHGFEAVLKGEAVVIEPSGVNRTILQKQLSALGYPTRCFDTCNEALENWPEDIGLIVVDVAAFDAPSGTSLERFCDTHADLPILLSTNDFSEVPSCIAEVANRSMLQKPAQRSALKDEIIRLHTSSGNDGPALREIRTPNDRDPRCQDTAYKVLVAEDNATNRLVFSKMIASHSAALNITFAKNGVEAVKSYKDSKPDIVFMDISMPKMDGKEATSLIRAYDPNSNTPIIAVTAHALAGDAKAILESGLDDYMSKPLRKAELFHKLDQHLNLKRKPKPQPRS